MADTTCPFFAELDISKQLTRFPKILVILCHFEMSKAEGFGDLHHLDHCNRLLASNMLMGSDFLLPKVFQTRKGL